MTVTIRMVTRDEAEVAARKPGVERIDEYTVECEVARHCDVVNWIVSAGLDMPEGV